MQATYGSFAIIEVEQAPQDTSAEAVGLGCAGGNGCSSGGCSGCTGPGDFLPTDS